MYAVVRTGGKQVRMTPGDAVRVETLPGSPGDRIELDQVLLIGGDGETRVGKPTVSGAKVLGTIKTQGRGPKITVFKMKRRKGYRRKQGHRQNYTEIQVDKIEG